MNKFIMALSATIAMFSLPVMAQKVPDGKSGFASSEACLAAVRAGSAMAYVPVTNRTPGSGYAQMSMAEAGYTNGACVQGLTTFTASTWVYLPPTFQIGKRDETIVMWQCGNAIKSIAKVPMVQMITRPAASTNFSSSAPLACKGEEECKQVNWCEANNGWYMSKDGAGNSIRRCDLPAEMSLITKENILRIQEKTIILPEQLPAEVRPWKIAAPVIVPTAPAIRVDVQGSQGPQVNMGRSQAGTVSGQSCTAGQGCSSRPVANFVSEVKADYCGIRTTDGRLFKLGHDKTSGLVTVTDFTNGEGSGYARMVLGGITGNDCDKVQELVEKRVWADMTRHFNLPSNCAVVQKVRGSNNKVS